MGRWVRLLMALLAVILVSNPAWAATGSLVVEVVDGRAETVEGATVVLSQDSDPLFTASTDASGRARFEGLARGSYQVDVSAAAGTGRLNEVWVRAGRGRVVQVELQPGSVLTEDFLRSVPSGRSYQAAVQLAAGVAVGSSQGGNPNIGGAAQDGQTIIVRAAEKSVNYGVNPDVLTGRDALSTFSIDVDTASYALARSSLNRGFLPDPASVRVEEFVNAQDYDYRPPVDGSPFTVLMDAAPNPVRSGHQLLRVAIQAQAPQIDRLPVHLTFLVDTSGSMQSRDKLFLAQRSLHFLVDQLGPEDRVALVTYAGSSRVVLEPTSAYDKARIHEAIDSLTSGGGTAMGSGMHLAYDLALETLVPGTENRVIVLSDGDANIGRTSHEDILSSLEGYAKRGISLSTVGYGRGNYNDTLMEQLADHGDGNYYYIDDFAEARKVFGEHLSGTLRTVARDVKVQVEFSEEAVISYRLLGYENRDIADADFRADPVDAGELGSGHGVTALYDVILVDRPKGDLATVRVRSKPPGVDAPAVEGEWSLSSRALHSEYPDASRDLRLAFSAALFAERLRGSPYAVEVSYVQIAKFAGEARAEDGLVELIERAGELSGESRRVVDW